MKYLMLKNLANIVVRLTLLLPYIWDKILSVFYKKSMKYCGRHVYIRAMSSDFKGLYNLSIGDGTSIPKRSTFYCTNAPLTI